MGKYLSNEEEYDNDDNDESSDCSFSLLDNLTVIEDTSLKMELNLSEESSEDFEHENAYTMKNEIFSANAETNEQSPAPSGSMIQTEPVRTIDFPPPTTTIKIENVTPSTSPIKKTQFADELIQKEKLKHEPAKTTKLPKAILKKVNFQPEPSQPETKSNNTKVKKKKIESKSVNIEKASATQVPQSSWAVKAAKSNKPDTNEHFKTETSPQNINLTLSKKRKTGKLKCPMCDKECKSKKNYNVHITIHEPNYPHKCDICGKASLNAIALANHRATHTGKNINRRILSFKNNVFLFKLIFF